MHFDNGTKQWLLLHRDTKEIVSLPPAEEWAVDMDDEYNPVLVDISISDLPRTLEVFDVLKHKVFERDFDLARVVQSPMGDSTIVRRFEEALAGRQEFDVQVWVSSQKVSGDQLAPDAKCIEERTSRPLRQRIADVSWMCARACVRVCTCVCVCAGGPWFIPVYMLSTNPCEKMGGASPSATTRCRTDIAWGVNGHPMCARVHPKPGRVPGSRMHPR